MRRLLFLVIIGTISTLLSACSSLAKPEFAGLQVITNDVPVALFLNEQYLDKTPFIDRQIKPGTYTLRIQPEDPSLIAYETRVMLRKGLLTVVTWNPASQPELAGGVVYEMEELNTPKRSELSFSTIPDNALISIDGGEKEFAPYINSTEPGHHEFELTLPGYETQRHTINVIDGHRTHVSVKLARNPTSQQAVASKPEPINSADDSPSSVLGASSSALVSLPNPKVIIKKTSFFHNSEEVLRVRSKPGSTGKEIGFAPVESEHPYDGETQQGWHKIEFAGQEGWVSGKYAQLLE